MAAQFVPEDRRAGLGGKECHDLVLAAMDFGRPLPPDRSAEVKILGNSAEVAWPKQDLRVFLVRQKGEWRVEAVGRAAGGDVLRTKGPGGLRYACYHWFDLVVKDPFKGIALPRLPGERELPSPSELVVWTGIEPDGGYRIRWRPVDDDGLETQLSAYADTKRDYDDPACPTVCVLNLGVSRDAPWTSVESVLRTAVGPDVRYRVGAFSGSTSEYGECGLPARFECRQVALIRYPEPAVELVADRGLGDLELAGLAEACRALPEKRREQGVRAKLADDLRAEDALRILAALAHADPMVIVVETVTPSPPSEVALDGVSVEPAAEPLAPRDDVVLRLAFEFR
jgi:hypothetical protein